MEDNQDLRDVMDSEKHRGKSRRGIIDIQQRERRRELRKIILRKDERQFFAFLRRYGIHEGSEEFAEAYAMWVSYAGKR